MTKAIKRFVVEDMDEPLDSPKRIRVVDAFGEKDVRGHILDRYSIKLASKDILALTLAIQRGANIETAKDRQTKPDVNPASGEPGDAN